MDLDISSTAFLAIHLQGDIVGPDGAFSGMFREQVEARQVLEVVSDLLAEARAAGALVVYTRVAFASDYSDMIANSPLLAGSRKAGCLKDGTPMAEIVDEVAPGPDDIVVTHQRVGGFAGSALEETLRSHGISTIVVMGVATNASVETTARWASDLGYRTILVADGCSAATLDAHEATVASLGMLAEITSASGMKKSLAAATAVSR